MSYCRFISADAYIFEHVGGYWQCCGCWLSESEDGSDWNFPTREAMLEHIAEHREAGHFIPTYVDERLREEIEQEREIPSV